MTRVIQDVAELACLNILHTPAWIFDIEGQKMLFGNTAALRLWNCASLNDLLNKNFSDSSEATKARLANYKMRFSKNEFVQEQWTFYPNEVASTYWCTSSGVLYKDKMVMLAEAMAKVQDKIETDTLRSLEAFRHSTVLISMYDTKKLICLQRNPSATKYFDALSSNDNANGGPFAHVLSDTKEKLLEYETTGHLIFESQVMSNEQRNRYHRIELKQTRDPVTSEKAMLVMEEDVTMRVEAEQCALNAERERVVAELEVKSKQEFVSALSHEIRTPINGIMGFAEALTKHLTNEEQKQLCTYIIQSAALLSSMMNNVFELSRNTLGISKAICRAPMHLPSMLQQVTALMHTVNKNSNVSIELKFDPKLEHVMLLGDDMIIKQVLVNLMSNAIKYTPKGFIRTAASIESACSQSCTVSFSVEGIQLYNIYNFVDTGIGIPEENFEKIFQRYNKLSASSTTATNQFDGLGMGLSIVKDSLARMDSKVSVSSQVGVGSKFSFVLEFPIHKSAITQSTHAVKLLPLTRGLIVEDEIINQKVLQYALKGQGANYIMVSDGMAAVKTFESQSFDFVLMDINLPVLNGIEATKQIRQIEKSKGLAPCLIIAMSANVASDKQNCLQAGLNDYISKPFVPSALIQRLESMLQSHQVASITS